ncbi:hypothetical protein BWZ22_04990 [Seonamhaeicola sp. S2-3]|uniref:DUF423 domain-containing protein n=1 Tax=Seonamhaeicola sp. S2-3 TaxID=1936081 RepID=UPI000972BE70|nr:DUF423 domain-containing protein [Seonamhaeicola sp. S2-3]APY10634.1 hypothetical protein BWZ22_04990 [Seonamhaeicola sp. S2-3]
MKKTVLVTAAALGLIAIVLGAFGAHGLKELISPEAQKTFETGVRYQMYHAILLLFVGNSALFSEKTMKILYYLVVVGVLFFSGSIYGLATNSLTSFNFKTIGFITPVGGLFFILAWGILIVKFLKLTPKTDIK